MKKFACLMTVIVLTGGIAALGQTSGGSSKSAPQAGKKGTGKKAQALRFPNTAEGAYQTFLYAGIIHNEKLLRESCFPAEGLELLLIGEAPPEEEFPKIHSQIQKMEFKRLKPGDKFRLPEGKSITIEDDEVDEDHVLIVGKGDPLPTRCERGEKGWKIRAEPIIAARKMALEAGKKAIEKKKKDDAKGDKNPPEPKAPPRVRDE